MTARVTVAMTRTTHPPLNLSNDPLPPWRGDDATACISQVIPEVKPLVILRQFYGARQLSPGSFIKALQGLEVRGAARAPEHCGHLGLLESFVVACAHDSGTHLIVFLSDNNRRG